MARRRSFAERFLEPLAAPTLALFVLLLWQAAVGNTVLFITHGIEKAIFLADRVIVMSPRPGSIDLDLTIPIARPRRWKAIHENAEFLAAMRKIREIFEAKGVLAAG